MRKSTFLGLALCILPTVAFSASVATPDYVLTPASGSKVDVMGTIVLDFVDSEVYFYEDSEEPAATLVNIDSEKVYECLKPAQNTFASVEGIEYILNFVNENDFDYPSNEPGTYELTIDNMYQIIDGENVDVEPITATFTIEYPVKYNLNPALDNAKNLQGLQIIFPDDNIGYYPSRMAVASLQGNTLYECSSPTIEYNSETGSTVTFTFINASDPDESVPETISTPGDYLLTVKALYTKDQNGEIDKDLPWLYLHYSIPSDSGSDTETFYMSEASVLEPESSYVSSIGFINLSYGGDPLTLTSPSTEENNEGYIYSTKPATLTISGQNESFNIYPYVMTILEGGNNPGIMPFADEDDEMKTEDILVLNFEEIIEKYEYMLPKGEYTISLPEGIVKDNAGAVNPSQTLIFYVMGSTDPGEVTPPDYDYELWQPYEYSAEELAAVTIDWNAPIEHINSSVDIILKEDAYTSTMPATPLLFGQEVTISDNKLVINLSKVAAGSWNVVIPEAYLIVGGEKINCEQVLSYIIVESSLPGNGITGIDTDSEGLYRIFDLNGINILNTEDSSAVRNLTPGLYIVNGKKVLVRK